ncbi:MAG: bifunctional glutamate N-acetyltransferase/amino-acid acetyltransferase ArgJ [Trueperaceae bacterium]
MKLPVGFQTSGLSSGIKESGKPDLGVIYSPYPLHWAFTSTENALKAPCVSRNRSRYTSKQPVHAVLVNSGNANCANGEQGIWDNEDMAGHAANVLSLKRVQDVLTASTGVVGQKLPVDKIKGSLNKLARQMTGDSTAFSEAILTTDLQSKQIAVTLESGARIVGIAKGSGMIHPNMATMLAFIMTDAALPQETLREIWQKIVNNSFNQVTVDGDTSPNDMAILLSSHQVRANANDFTNGLLDVCSKLAQKIARDGEGATKLLTVKITGARNELEARQASRAVVRSPLVKAAIHGNDPNWGRILVAVGNSGAVSDMAGLTIKLQSHLVYKGQSLSFDAAAVSGAMKAVSEVFVEVELAAGNASATAWGCDLSAEYVHVNADYTT